MAKHKRKHHSKMAVSMERPYRMEDGGDATYKTRHMMPNNRNSRALIHEDMSRPCGLPMGAHQRDIGDGSYFSMNAFRVGDLFEQVDKTMREDAAAIKSITKPTNW